MKHNTTRQDDTVEGGESESWISGTKLYTALFVVLFLLLYLLPSMINIIPAGHAGVLYRPLLGGTYLERSIPEGLAIVSPLDSIAIYNLRLQEHEESVDVLSMNGLTIEVSVSFRFAPERQELPYLHVGVGPDYDRKVVIPTVIASVREVVGKYLPEELYTTHRNTVQEEMDRDIKRRLVGKHIYFETILIRNIRLPQLINVAIENKLRQQQESEEYVYRIERERKEMDRKKIEAEGWQQFQAIVSGNLTEEYLRWKWIDSMLALSRSDNAKVVVLGEGQTEKIPISLPLIMSPLSTTTAQNPQAEREATQGEIDARFNSPAPLNAAREDLPPSLTEERGGTLPTGGLTVQPGQPNAEGSATAFQGAPPEELVSPLPGARTGGNAGVARP